MLIRLLPLTILLMIACSPPPAWEPGDPPLTFSVDSDRTGELVLMGCAFWAQVGLRCELVDRGATVRAWEEDLTDGNNAYSTPTPCGLFWTDWDYTIRFDPNTTILLADDIAPEYVEGALERAGAIAAHEIGHLLGIWHHLSEAALMDPTATVTHVTPADVRALPWAGELR